MRSLLDVNVVIALLDIEHFHYEAATDWFGVNAAAGWASCPLTQNGVIRILSNPNVGPAGTTAEVARTLAQLCARDDHEFWADDISILDARRIDPTQLGGSSSLTDTYLLALAVAHNGRLATFDRRLATAAAIGGAGRVVVIG